MSFNFMATVTDSSDFRAQERKSVTVSTFPPIYLPSSDGTGCHDLSFVLLPVIYIDTHLKF